MKYLRFKAIYCAIVLASCSNINQIDPLEGIKFHVPDYCDVPESISDAVLYISFDGSCASCIVTFLQWLQKWNENPYKSLICYFISFSNDVYQVEYYIDEFGIELQSNQYLVADPSKQLLEQNQSLNGLYNIILVRNNRIISSEDPFSSKRAKKKYSNQQ